jgi:hypothetical protein
MKVFEMSFLYVMRRVLRVGELWSADSVLERGLYESLLDVIERKMIVVVDNFIVFTSLLRQL